ncbi:MAG: hypothetical protein JRJ51_01905 [Deltaproteobacteria bacterium]|nr:hypothetical protein [Deltaproteobacteria bacterium]
MTDEFSNGIVMFLIETKSLKLQLEVVRVDSLLQHEEIIPQLGNQLMLEFKNWANLQNPIIIGENHIVLDGHHRVYAFRKLGFKHIPVCKIDYHHETAQLRYWFRLLVNVENPELLREIVEAMNGDFRHVEDMTSLQGIMDDNRLSFGIQHGEYFASITFREDRVRDALSAYDMLEKIQEKLKQRGFEMSYVPCQSVSDEEFCATLNEGDMLVWTPQITKEMVLETVEKRQVFPPKTTRHLIPARPINVNAPIHWFKEDIPLAQINERFVDFLKQKRIRRFGPGQVIEGRYYEEELFVFYDEKK